MFDVITIGTATRDVYLISKVFRPITDPHFKKRHGFINGKGECFPLGSKIEVDDVHITTGGGATNAAVTFSRQGFKTATVAKVGKDLPSKVIREELIKEKITPLLVNDAANRTAYSTLLLSPGGERTILVYRGASEDLKTDDIPWTKLSSKWVYFAAGGINFSLLSKSVNFFHARKTKIALNPGKDQLSLSLLRLSPILRNIDVLILNREEASRLTKIDYSEEKNIIKVLEKHFKGILVMTDGSRGVIVSNGATKWRVGVFKERKLVDRTGAGDAFGSGFVAGLMQKNDMNYALRLASANATSNVESIGAKSGLLTKREFIKSPRWENLSVKKV